MAEGGTTGSIYDLGYRRYGGVRLGRRHAVWVLYLHSLRSVFGIGRSFWAKAAAFGILGIALIPAVVQLGIAAVAPQRIDIVPPEDYYAITEPLLAVFCAVVAPDLAARDQRSKTLALYFSRPIRRSDHALAKFLALATGMLAITAIPQLLMFTGNASAADDVVGYVREHWWDLPAIMASAALLSCLVASVGLAIAAQTDRRAYSAVGILAVFLLVSGTAAAIFAAAENGTGRLVLLLSPFHLARGSTFWMFGVGPEPGSQLDRAGFAGGIYFLAAVGMTALALAVVLRRYERIPV